jgi:hypothetical protein
MASLFVPQNVIVIGASGGVQIITTDPVVVPSAGGGVAAPVGSIYMGVGVGATYLKTGAADTAWTALATAGSDPLPNTLQFPAIVGLNSALTAKTLGSTAAQVCYYGRAPRAYAVGETITANYIVTNAGSGFTWGEIAIGKGSIPSFANPSVTPVGFVNIAANLAANASYSTAIPVSAGQSIAQGDDVWLIFAKLSTGSPDLRGAAFGDVMQIGLQGTANMRPSTAIGTPTSFTREAAATGPILAALRW